MIVENKFPKEVKILNIVYTIEYYDNPSEVDSEKRKSMWGQIDYWTRTIRVYDNEKPSGDIWQTIWHEIIHGIANALHLDEFVDDEGEVVDLLATGLQSVIADNDWINTK